MTVKTSDIQLTFNSKTAAAYVAEPEQGGPGVLLLHAWWGLKPFFKQTCDRLAGQGFVVLAPDLRQGRIATTVKAAEELMEHSDRQLTGEIVVAARDHLIQMPERRGERIGVIGFSMGGGWALMLAANAPEQVGATVLFYGSGDEDFSKVRGGVLGHFSDVDEWEPYADIQLLEKKMRAAGVDVTFHTYPGRAHWFVEEDRPEYDAEAAGQAWDRTFKFLKAGL